MRDITLGDTFYHFFTTRAFATGVPTTLAGTPVLSVLEENNVTPITAGVSVSVDRATVVGMNIKGVHGSNRAFLEQHLPHINRLLHEDLEAAVATADIVVIGHGDARFRRDEEWRALGKIVVRLS